MGRAEPAFPLAFRIFARKYLACAGLARRMHGRTGLPVRAPLRSLAPWFAASRIRMLPERAKIAVLPITSRMQEVRSAYLRLQVHILEKCQRCAAENIRSRADGLPRVRAGCVRQAGDGGRLPAQGQRLARDRFPRQ